MVLVQLAGVLAGMGLVAAMVYGFLRALCWPLLAWSRWRLRRQVLAHDATVQTALVTQGDPRGTFGRYPPAC